MNMKFSFSVDVASLFAGSTEREWLGNAHFVGLSRKQIFSQQVCMGKKWEKGG
jgi:hypothetical protein